MINGISGVNSYYPLYQQYGAAAQQRMQTQNVQRPGNLWAAQRAASPETPVQPVTPAPVVKSNATGNVSNLGIPIREGVDPAEMAVRMRIQYGAEPAAAEKAAAADGNAPAKGAEGVQQAAEEGKCQTCENRKYQDGSDDMSVSFQTPTRIDPSNVASAVRGHEMEHVSHEQAKAKQEDRKVVSQSVTLHTAICPECGKTYISGGTTRTTTAANNTPEYGEQQSAQDAQTRTPFAATA